jgi:hypothetical protein
MGAVGREEEEGQTRSIVGAFFALFCFFFRLIHFLVTRLLFFEFFIG